MSPTLRLLALTLTLSACSESAVPATQISLVLTSDLAIPDQLDELRVRVVGPDGSEQSASGLLRTAEDLPRRVVLRHTQGELAPLDVTAEGLAAGNVVVTRRARFAFVLHERRAVELALLARCVDVTCDEGSCAEDGCGDVALAPDSTDADAGSDVEEPEPMDAAASGDEAEEAGIEDAALDGGVADGGRPGDAGARDAGPSDGGRVPPADGGWTSPDGCVPTQACVTACSEAPPRLRAEICQCLRDCQ